MYMYGNKGKPQHNTYWFQYLIGSFRIPNAWLKRIRAYNLKNQTDCWKECSHYLMNYCNKLMHHIFHITLMYRATHCNELSSSPFYWHGLTLNPARISNCIHYIVWDEITYPSLNFNGATVEVQKWISNTIPHFTRHVIPYPCWD